MKKVIIILTVLLLSCTSKQEPSNNSDVLSIIFIGHSYKWHEKNKDRIDPRIEKINYSNYDEIWLGGDLVLELKSKNTLLYLDKIFDLKSPKTFWTFGNHDLRKGYYDKILEFTGKKSYYATYSDGITRIILNTEFNNQQVVCLQDSMISCYNLDQQIKLIKNVTDTIKESKYLIIISHLATWDNLETDFPQGQSNTPYPQYCFTCNKNSQYEKVIYPLLKKVRERGVKVVNISGDFGQRNKAFHYMTRDSILYLGSGINNSILSKPESLSRFKYVKNTNPDSILTLKYDKKTNVLTYKFHNLNNFTGE